MTATHTWREGDELPEENFGPITRSTLALLAGGSGDHNPIHIDLDFARSAGGLQALVEFIGLGQARVVVAPHVAVVVDGFPTGVARHAVADESGFSLSSLVGPVRADVLSELARRFRTYAIRAGSEDSSLS